MTWTDLDVLKMYSTALYCTFLEFTKKILTTARPKASRCNLVFKEMIDCFRLHSPVLAVFTESFSSVKQGHHEAIKGPTEAIKQRAVRPGTGECFYPVGKCGS